MVPWSRLPGPALLIAALLLGIGQGAAFAQGPAALPRNLGNPVPAKPKASNEEPTAERAGIFLPPDRNLLILLSKAKQLETQGQYAEAVRCLGTILEAPEDFFFSNERDAGVVSSLKTQAQAILGRMPAGARDAYELQFGAQARRILAEASAAGDAGRLAEVVRRFFHTQAGYEAAYLLGLHQMDQGYPRAALILLERLRSSCPTVDRFEPDLSLASAACRRALGEKEQAAKLTASLRERFPGKAAWVADREMSSTDEIGERLGTMRAGEESSSGAPNWLLARGDATRNAESTSGAPLLSISWHIPTTDADDRGTAAVIEQLQQAGRNVNQWAVPAFQPIVAGNHTVLMRTTTNLLAVDLLTGKRLWEVPREHAAQDDQGEEATENPFTSTMGPSLGEADHLRLRLWGDTTYGTLASDGQRVYAIEDLPTNYGFGFFGGMPGIFAPGRPGRTGAEPRVCNRLAAYDVRTGKLLWHLGGDPNKLKLRGAGMFFLGPPLPLQNLLYAIAEINGEVRLAAIESQTGEIRWTQNLAIVEQDRQAAYDPLRRSCGASPSYADGILVCPTTNHSVVAVEPMTRSLLWGYVAPQTGRMHAAPGAFRGSLRSDVDPSRRWAGTTAILAEGNVILTLAESNDIHCLNLIDGRVRWLQPRSDAAYAACAHAGHVVLASRTGVRIVRSVDGKGDVALPWPDGAQLAGLGFLKGDRFFFPLDPGMICAVDVRKKTVDGVWKSRRGASTGNLVGYGDWILSQRAGGVDAFRELDSLRRTVDRRLAAAPDDLDALLQQGEILWNDGKPNEAVECFRKVYRKAASENSRVLLREALFEGLRLHFAEHRGAAREIESLLDDDAQRAVYLGLMVAGGKRMKEYETAAAYLTRFIELPGRHDSLVSPFSERFVQRSRWIRAQLNDIVAEAPPSVVASLDALAQTRLAEAMRQDNVDALESALDLFGDRPVAEEARRRLATKYMELQRLSAAEMLLRETTRSADRVKAAAAWAELAVMYRNAALPVDAAVCAAELNANYADVVCRDGKTGRAWLESLPADDPIRAGAKSPFEGWPTTHLRVDTVSLAKTNPPTYGNAAIPFDATRSPFLADSSLEWLQTGRCILRDAWGRVQWQIPSVAVMGNRGEQIPLTNNIRNINNAVFAAAARDHLLFFIQRNRVVAVDLLGKGGPKILWEHAIDESGDASSSRRADLRNGNVAARAPSAWNLSQELGAMSRLVPLGERIVCFQRLRSITALDSLTGKVLWTRDGIAAAGSNNATLFGDEQYLFAAEEDGTTFHVLRSTDGESLGKRKLPGNAKEPVPHKRRTLWTIGRNVVLLQRSASESTGKIKQCTVELHDLWTGKPCRPPVAIELPSLFQNATDTAAVALTSEGRLLLVDVVRGRILIDHRTSHKHNTVNGVHVVASEDGYTVLLNLGPTNADASRSTVYGIAGADHIMVPRGLVYEFDPSGKPKWEEPVAIADQALLTNQPKRLPLLLFACGVHDRRGGGMFQPRTAIVAIDKRTGRLLRPESPLPGNTHFHITPDMAKKAIEIGLQNHQVRFVYDDKPAKPVSSAEALFKAMKRAVRPPLVPVPSETGDDDRGKTPLQIAPPAVPAQPPEPKAAAPVEGKNSKGATPATPAERKAKNDPPRDDAGKNSPAVPVEPKKAKS